LSELSEGWEGWGQCILGVIDYSVSGKCGGGRDNRGKGVRGEEGKEKRRKSWGRERKVGQERA
jgi:hypothetical protein